MGKLPTTPEGWVAEKERELALRRARGDLELVDPKYDNWLLWVNWLLWIEYQRRILGKSLSPTSRVKAGMVLTANALPRFLKDGGRPDIPALAAHCGRSPKTVKAHLNRLQGLGADFSRIDRWPHPTRPAV